ESAPITNHVSDLRVRARVSAGLGVGAHDVVVTCDGGSVSLPGGLFVLPPAAPGTLAIHGAIPSEGDVMGGTLVHLAGDGFTNATDVTVGGEDAISFEVLLDRLLLV